MNLAGRALLQDFASLSSSQSGRRKILPHESGDRHHYPKRSVYVDPVYAEV
jgi:hypothetical protein